jgi:hypothetical protein
MFNKKENTIKKDGVSNDVIDATLKMIFEMPNFCEKILALKKFEKTYNESEFYNVTRIDLTSLFKDYCESRIVSPKEFLDYIQEHINSLNVDNLKSVLSDFVHDTDKQYEETIKQAKEIGLDSKLKEAGLIK